MRKSFRDRFFEKVSKRPTKKGCLVWIAGCFENRYGEFRFLNKTEKAHRFAWEMVWGAIPVGYKILHSCDNPPCVNIAHLGLGTLKDNSQDAKKKGRLVMGDQHWSRTNPERLPRGAQHWSRMDPERRAHGERNGLAKLTGKDITRICHLSSIGMMGIDIAGKLEVSPSTINKVLKGKTWRHIPRGDF